MKIVGIEDGTYTSKKDGQVKEGDRFYVTDDTLPGVTGVGCAEVWVATRVAAGFLEQFPDLGAVLGADVMFLYNRFRRVEAIMPLPVAAAKK